MSFSIHEFNSSDKPVFSVYSQILFANGWRLRKPTQSDIDRSFWTTTVQIYRYGFYGCTSSVRIRKRLAKDSNWLAYFQNTGFFWKDNMKVISALTVGWG